MNNIIDTLRNTCISSGNIIIFSGIISSLISGKMIGLIFSAGLLINIFLNVLFKYILKIFFPNYIPFLRPSISKKGCGITIKCLPYKISNTKEQGMPSGHSQMATFSSTFWILYIWRYLRYTKMYNHAILYPSTFILILLSIIIMISRSFLVENCHTVLQIIIGGILGILFSWGFYTIIENFAPKLLDNKN